MSAFIPSLAQIESSGYRLLELTGQPVPRWRILKDVLTLPDESDVVNATSAALLTSRWVKELEDTQQPDGTWGRFHSRDSKLHNRFPTTELAIRRALCLGLEKDSSLLQRSMGYMHGVLDGNAAWSDPAEKHEGWPVNLRSITAATLTSLDPTDPTIIDIARSWAQIAAEAFASGSYDPEAERAAHLRIHGIKTRGKYLKLASLYPLLLLSTPSSGLSLETEKALLNWVWQKHNGIYYIYGSCLAEAPALTSAHFVDWLRALSLLARFRTSKGVCASSIEWLWIQQDEQGLWDFGIAARNGYELPLSENWKDPLSRKIDCSIQVLALMRDFLHT
jgi:hypothetical protein